MFRYLALFLLYSYRVVISPFTTPSCRYIPTCSEYSIQVFKQYPLGKAVILTIKRLLSCHPWNSK